MSQMSPESRQHLRKVAREEDASQSQAKFRLEQADADILEAKEKRVAAEKSKEKTAERRASLKKFKPVLDIKLLRETGSGGDTAKRIQRQVMWHRRIGDDVSIPPGVHKMKKAEAWVVMVWAVRRHLSGTSKEKGDPLKPCVCSVVLITSCS